jgi:hypothetical protein
MSHIYSTLSDGQKDRLNKAVKERLHRYEIMQDVTPLLNYIIFQLSKQKDEAEIVKALDEMLRDDTVSFVSWLWRTIEDISKVKDLVEFNIERSKDDSDDKRRENAITRNRHRNRSRSVSPHRRTARTDERFARDGNRLSSRLVSQAMNDANGNSQSGRSVIIERLHAEPQPMQEDVSFTVTLSSLQEEDEKKRKRVERFGAETLAAIKTPSKRKHSQVDDWMEEDNEYDESSYKRNKRGGKKSHWQQIATKRPFKRPRVERCKFWPRCTNPECTYHHPTEVCKNFPECQFGSSCLYVHPVSPILCKFGVRCLNGSCTFIHPPRVLKACKSGYACNNFSCRYAHPVEGCKFGMSCTKTSCPFTHATACRYGSDCHLPSCHFAHFSKENSSLLSSQEVQVSVDEDRDEKSEHVDLEQQSNSARVSSEGNNTNNNETSSNNDVNMNVDVNLEDRDLKIEDLSIANLSNSLPKTPPTKEEMPTTIIKIED